jgi:hypothetical protein
MDTWSENGEDHENVMLPPPVFIQPKKTTANRNLIQKIESIIASYELQEKYSTHLTPYSLSIIEKLIKTKPEFFRIVESTLVRNVNGSMLRANDVPYVISIISQLFNLLITSHFDLQVGESPADSCGHLLKFIFSVAIKEKIVKIDDETEATLLLLCFDNIIDACTKLLKLKAPAPAPAPVSVIKEEVDKKKKSNLTDCCC